MSRSVHGSSVGAEILVAGSDGGATTSPGVGLCVRVQGRCRRGPRARWWRRACPPSTTSRRCAAARPRHPPHGYRDGVPRRPAVRHRRRALRRLARARGRLRAGCVAHLDGDVIYHSVVDAILGALHACPTSPAFPTTTRCRADSQIFMEEAYKRGERGYRIGNCDVTLIPLQKPKVNAEYGGEGTPMPHEGAPVRLLHTAPRRQRQGAHARQPSHPGRRGPRGRVLSVILNLHAVRWRFRR